MDNIFLTLNEKNIIINDNNYKLLINKYLKENKITSYELEFIDNYYNKGNLINSKYFIEIINKIGSEELNNLIINKIPKIIKKSDTIIKSKIKDINKQIIQDKKININFTLDQKKAIYNILKFLSNINLKSYGLYGYAGTGKTTIIIEIITFLLKNKIIKSVVFTALTNKAVNVMKYKFREYIKELYESYFDKELKNNFNFDEILHKFFEASIIIDFVTIHKLLKYEIDYGEDGEIIFVKSNDTSLIGVFELIIIDECSMIPIKIIESIFIELRKSCLLKVIFCGDPAQLPPVNELLSIIFMKSIDCFKYDDYFKKIHTNIDKDEKNNEMNYKTNYKILSDEIINMKTSTLKQVMRSKLDGVTNICYQIRLWAIDKVKIPKLQKYIKNGVYAYKYDISTKKINTDWFKKCLEYYNKGIKCNIILCWTNKQADEYNLHIRKLLFNKKILDKFEINDILMLNDFYNLNDEKKTFYTSEQIKIIKIDKIMKNINNFELIINNKQFNLICKSIIDTINFNTTRNYLCWKLHVVKIGDDLLVDKKDISIIYIIDDKDQKKWQYECEFISDKIKQLKKQLISKFKDKLNLIDSLIIKPLWKQFHITMIHPFANVNYGYAITCHKGQGSNYYNVFVDIHDIVKNNNENETKKCLYTAMTRASNELHILLTC